MADAGALRRPAVAGHAGAVVEHVGDVQLHVCRSTSRNRVGAEIGVRRVLTSPSPSLFPERSSGRNASETETDDRRGS